MATALRSAFRKLRPSSIWGTVSSPSGVATFKGVLSYTLVFVLVFLRGFEGLTTFPITYTSAIIVAIAGFPGKSVGACVASLFMGLLGVAVGAFNFYVLAKLGHAYVGQAFVFFVMVYVLALIKTQGQQYFAFALLATLMSFNGIYTSILLNGQFSSTYLTDYFRAYLWGGAIVLFVNICVLPHSAEKELRRTLVTSLDHIRTFAHLIGKTYRQDISDEEAAARDALNQSIRADFGLLRMKLSETFIEVNWSRWSMADYGRLVMQTRKMQQCLITTYSSLMGVESKSLDLFHQDFLDDVRADFDKLQKSLHVALTNIQHELNVGHWEPAPKEVDYYKEIDLERQESAAAYRSPLNGGAPGAAGGAETPPDAAERLRTIQDQLLAELAGAPSTGNTPQHSRRPSLDGSQTVNATDSSTHSRPASRRTATDKDVVQDVEKPLPKPTCTSALRSRWHKFSDRQLDRIGDILASGELHGGSDYLLVDAPGPSLKSFWGRDLPRGRAQTRARDGHAVLRELKAAAEAARDSADLSGAGGSGSGGGGGGDGGAGAASPQSVSTHHSLVRVYSFTFAMEAFIETVVAMHRFTAPCGERRKKRVHVHVFEGVRLGRKRKRLGMGRPAGEDATEAAKPVDNDTPDMTMQEALCALESKEYHPVKMTLWQRLHGLEQLALHPNSICAFKTACAVIIFSVLFWSTTIRSFAVNYSINSGLLTIVVALTPTLGQSLVSFMLQILGQGIGYLFAFVALEIFNGVGGYKYNPYGLACFLAVYSIPLCWVLYTNPKFFVMALLAMNSAGVLIVTEWTYRERPRYDSPAYRMGKGLTTLAIALGIVAAFQLLILRNPARRTLRKAVAHLMRENMTYTIILQAYVRGTVPDDPKAELPPKEAIQRVATELRKRELRIQAEIIDLMPLMFFAGSEFSPVSKFDAGTWMRLIRSCQLILDRNRDARIAIGTKPLDEFIITHFVSALSPYRHRATRLGRAAMYLCTASLQSKFPLPHDIPRASELLPGMFHDALTLSTRLARTDRGKELVKTQEFTRYWLYLLSATSVGYQLEEVEAAIKKLFGELEDDPYLYSRNDV